MTSEMVPTQRPGVRRIVPSVLGILIGITAAVAFLAGTQILNLGGIWPALGRTLEPLNE